MVVITKDSENPKASSTSPNGKKMKSPAGWGTRHTLSVLGFLGFTLSYSMRFNLSLAMVSMVDRGDAGSRKLHHSEGGDACPVSVAMVDVNRTDGEAKFIGGMDMYSNRSGMGVAVPLKVDSWKPNVPTFDWDERDQGLIMGCFFWGYMVTQYPGGRLSHSYGAKWIISGGLLITGIISLILPAVTVQWDKTGLMVLRVIQGLGEGVTFPAMHCMLGKWAPPDERSRMTTIVFSGVPFGTAITMVVGGYVIRFFGWPTLFYSVGVFSIVWFVLWTFLVFSDPNDHPRISFEELEYIQSSVDVEGKVHLDGGENTKHVKTPWKEILTSLPVWSIVICHIFHSWSHYLLHIETPKYLQSVHHFAIEHNGWFSAMPQFINVGVSLVMANVSDVLIKSGVTSIAFTRKLCTSIALWGSAAAFLGIIFGGCDTIVAVTCLNLAGGALGASFGGWIVNNIDVAPNHGGTIMGATNSFSTCLGFVAPFVSGLILHAMPDMQLAAWKIIFLIPAVLNILCCIFYIIFASATVQSWNSPKNKQGK